MVRVRSGNKRLAGIALLGVFLLVGAACSGGGGDGDGVAGVPTGTLAATNFLAILGPGNQVLLPSLFIDQTLEFEFVGAVDDGIFGGFVVDGTGNPVESFGVGAQPSLAVPYLAFVDQAAAQAGFEIRENTQNGPLLDGYVIGRHRDRPDTIVIDPRVSAFNPFGLTPNAGFLPESEYTYRILANSGLTVSNGVPVRPAGVDPMMLPIVLSPESPLPQPSPVFRAGSVLGGNPTSPQVVAIEAYGPMGLVAGTASDPLPSQGGFILIRFSAPVDPTSLDLGVNLVVRNTDVVTSGEPEGILVPGTIVVPPPVSDTVTFTPLPTFGPGLSLTQGYAISVSVGSFGDPGVAPILGLPQGSPPAQLPLANSMQSTFTTDPCPTCPGSFNVVESFTSGTQEDTGYAPVFGTVGGWANAATPGELVGSEISGTPLAGGNPQNLGSRTQVAIPIGPGTTLPLTTIPFSGLFSPFDSASNNLGASVNPNGGSHSMWLTDAVDIGNPTSSLELVEWGPVNNLTITTTYPQYQAWAGSTTRTAPLNCPAGLTGLSASYADNYDIAPVQAADPLNLNPAQPVPGAGGVQVTAPSPYVLPSLFTSHVPFPVFSPPYDYIGSGQGAGGLLLEINIEPGSQLPNFNRYRATAATPARRLIGAPLSSGLVVSEASGCDTYAFRFTFVDVVASSQSLFYDVNAGGVPSYLGIALTPSPASQPAGTSSRWEFEGATGLLAPNQPAGSSTGFLTYWDGMPGTGSFNPLVLADPANPMAPQLTGNRYFRFRATLRSDNITNARPRYSSLIAVIGL